MSALKEGKETVLVLNYLSYSILWIKLIYDFIESCSARKLTSFNPSTELYGYSALEVKLKIGPWQDRDGTQGRTLSYQSLAKSHQTSLGLAKFWHHGTVEF